MKRSASCRNVPCYLASPPPYNRGTVPMSWLRFSATLLVVHGKHSLLGVRAFAGYRQVRLIPRVGLSSRGASQAFVRAPPRFQMSTAGTQAGEGTGNRLAGETSPYLLQHANNPVDWMPWGEEAFRKAAEEDKPVFLSVGYSTCHWCHVMERESFESQAVARVLNSKFVSIKVDREERPDVDQCFMTFVQATSGGGGWPMSVWLTPDLTPFVGATYFPERRFIEVLEMIAEKWDTEREGVVQQGNRIVEILRKQLDERAAAGGDPEAFLALPKSREAVRKAVRDLDAGHDDDLGGWGGGRGGMKFPQPCRFNLLLRAYYLEGEKSKLGARALRMVETTLSAMAKGGIYDHLLDGFARYSTDPRWHVPHFEKMLYDQSQLVTAYVEAYQVTGDERYADVARGVLRYVLRDMTDTSGGFYSAEDADSLPFEGAAMKKEGAFCVWTEPDLRRFLDAEGVSLPSVDGESVPLSRVFASVYGVRAEGNVDPSGDVHGELTSQNVLFLAKTVGEASRDLGLACKEEETEAALKRAREVLVGVRRKRPAPHLDDKVLTSWNGLMISALARASQAFARSFPPSGESLLYLQAAEKAAEFVRSNLYVLDTDGGDGGRTSGTLLRSWRSGRASEVQGFADDYAFLIRGLLDLYEADPRHDSGGRWLQWARDLQLEMDEGFTCPPESGGGYYGSRAPGDAGDGGEVTDPGALPLRLKTDYDGAEPGAGSVAADNLLRLSAYLGGERGEELRRNAIQQLASTFSIPESTQGYPELTASLVRGVLGPKQVIIAGDPDAEDTQALLCAVQRTFCPNLVLLLTGKSANTALPSGDQGAATERNSLVSFFGEILNNYGGVYPTGEGGAAAAYVCFEKSCSPPILSPQELTASLIVASRT